MDIAQKVAFFTMDVTSDIAFGRAWGCLEKDEDVDKWFTGNEIVLPKGILVSTIPWLTRFLAIPVIGRLVMPSESDPNGAGRLI